VLQSGSEGLPNYCVSWRYVKSLPDIRICFGSLCMECSIKLQAPMVI
jgi:hypothetical protein